MKYSTVRGLVNSAILEFFRYDAQTLEAPPRVGSTVYPPASLVIEPVADLVVSTGQTQKCTASFPVSVCYRFPKSYLYSELPIADIETMAVSFMSFISGLGGSLNVSFPVLANPVTVATDTDWLVTLRPVVAVSWVLTPEIPPASIQPTVPPTTITLSEYFLWVQNVNRIPTP